MPFSIPSDQFRIQKLDVTVIPTDGILFKSGGNGDPMEGSTNGWSSIWQGYAKQGTNYVQKSNITYPVDVDGDSTDDLDVSLKVPDSALSTLYLRTGGDMLGGIGDRGNSTNDINLTESLQVSFSSDVIIDTIGLTDFGAGQSAEYVVGGGSNTISSATTGGLSIPLSAGDWITFQLADTNSVDSFRLWKLGLTVTNNLFSPYEQWAANAGLTNGVNAAQDDNPDLDNLNNLYEYGLGGDPLDPNDVGIFPTSSVVDNLGTIWFEYVYRRRTGSQGVSYGLELNQNLANGSWTDIGTSAETATGTINADFESVTNHISTAIESVQFIHLLIEETP